MLIKFKCYMNWYKMIPPRKINSQTKQKLKTLGLERPLYTTGVSVSK